MKRVKHDYQLAMTWNSLTSIVLKNPSAGELFYTRTKQRYKSHETPDPGDELELIPIPLDDVWPLAMLYDLVEAPNPIPSNGYIKRPSLLGYEEFQHRYGLSDMLIHEANVCESLSQSVHRQILWHCG